MILGVSSLCSESDGAGIMPRGISSTRNLSERGSCRCWSLQSLPLLCSLCLPQRGVILVWGRPWGAGEQLLLQSPKGGAAEQCSWCVPQTSVPLVCEAHGEPSLAVLEGVEQLFRAASADQGPLVWEGYRRSYSWALPMPCGGSGTGATQLVHYQEDLSWREISQTFPRLDPLV